MRAALPRIVIIDNVEIRGAGGNKNKSDTLLRMTGTAKTYRYLDDDEMPAKKPAAKAGGRKR